MLFRADSGFAILRGQGRPGVAAIAMLFGAWGLAVPLAWLFGLHQNHGVVGLWWGMAVGYGTAAFIMSVMVLRSDWEQESRNTRKRVEAEGDPKGPVCASDVKHSVDDEHESGVGHYSPLAAVPPPEDV